MKSNTRITRINGKIIVSELVLAGTMVMGLCYEPATLPVKPKNSTTIGQYIDNGKYSVEKSEARKKEIISNIRDIRKQMAAVATKPRWVDANTKVRPCPRKMKEAMVALQAVDTLMDRITA